MNCKQSGNRLYAIKEEIKYLLENEIWTLVDKHASKELVACK